MLHEEESVELEQLFACLADSESSEVAGLLLGRIAARIPFAHHPVPYIERLHDPLTRRQIRQKYSQVLNYRKLRLDWETCLAAPGEPDLEAGALLISRLGDEPEFSPENVRQRLDELALPLGPRLSEIPEDRPYERLETFRRYVFDEHAFQGNQQEYYDPANSFLATILDTRRGIPISLSVLCLLLARRVGLRLFGINFPGHFLVKYSQDDYCMFLDPFNGGDLITENDCFFYLIRQGLEPSRRHLVEADSLTILKRMYRNLMNIYSSRNDSVLNQELREHFAILENASLQS